MGDSLQKFLEQQGISAKINEKVPTENVKNILDLYNLLSIEEKVQIKRLIREQKVF